jgi:hypothetical protein
VTVTVVTVGGVVTASTVIETPLALVSMTVALSTLLTALAIVDCTESTVALGVWMLTSMFELMTLAAVTPTSTADGSTPAS